MTFNFKALKFPGLFFVLGEQQRLSFQTLSRANPTPPSPPTSGPIVVEGHKERSKCTSGSVACRSVSIKFVEKKLQISLFSLFNNQKHFYALILRDNFILQHLKTNADTNIITHTHTHLHTHTNTHTHA